MTNKLGINGDSIRFEVALEILGQELQPFIQALREEKAQASPCRALIQFFESRLQALSDLQHALHPSDYRSIEKVLDKEYRLIRVPPRGALHGSKHDGPGLAQLDPTAAPGAAGVPS